VAGKIKKIFRVPGAARSPTPIASRSPPSWATSCGTLAQICTELDISLGRRGLGQHSEAGRSGPRAASSGATGTPDDRPGPCSALAYGDALGKPTEFLPVEEILAPLRTRPARATLPVPALVTDDTQMALAVARALADTPPP